MTERNDHDLGEQFHALRREDAAAAPPFHATLAAARARPAPPPGPRRPWRAAAAAAVAGGARALRFTRPARGGGEPKENTTVRWKAPPPLPLPPPGEEPLR